MARICNQGAESVISTLEKGASAASPIVQISFPYAVCQPLGAKGFCSSPGPLSHVPFAPYQPEVSTPHGIATDGSHVFWSNGAGMRHLH